MCSCKSETNSVMLDFICFGRLLATFEFEHECVPWSHVIACTIFTLKSIFFTLYVSSVRFFQKHKDDFFNLMCWKSVSNSFTFVYV